MAASYSALPASEKPPAEGDRLLPNAPPPPGPPEPLVEPYAGLVRHGEWSSGFFDCCSLPGGAELFFLSWLCPCYQFGLIAKQLPQVSSLSSALSRNPDGVIFGGSLPGACLTYFGLAVCAGASLTVSLGLDTTSSFIIPCVLPLHLQLRTYLRSKYGLQGDLATNVVQDVLGVWCCPACALCQEAREIAIRSAAERAALARLQALPQTDPRSYTMSHAPAVAPPPTYVATVSAPPPPAMGIPVAAPPQPPAGKHD